MPAATPGRAPWTALLGSESWLEGLRTGFWQKRPPALSRLRSLGLGGACLSRLERVSQGSLVTTLQWCELLGRSVQTFVWQETGKDTEAPRAAACWCGGRAQWSVGSGPGCRWPCSGGTGPSRRYLTMPKCERGVGINNPLK